MLRVAPLTAVLMLVLAGFSMAQTQPAPWPDLTRHIGTYDYDAVMSEPLISSEIDETVGPARRDLEKRLEVHAPIGFMNGCLVLQGLMPRRGGEDEGLLMVCPNQRKVSAVITMGSDVHVYAPTRHYNHLPRYLKRWIALYVRHAEWVTAPENVQIHATESIE